jgi:MYXO-CTERM domain-containing protein
MVQNGCTWDSDGCATAGKFLFWPSSCAWFGVQQDGSPKRKVPYAEAHDAIANAFVKWGKAKCSGGTPSFAMDDTDDMCGGPPVCNVHEFHKDTANASVWMFRDDGWPYVGATTTIALTTLSVEIKSGRIFDADVEINSFGTDITTSDTNVVADLDSIVTHEAGHYLGLAHSPDPESTMYASYSPASVSIRSLSPDDEAAICAAYPPKSTPTECGPPEPLFGYSRYCNGANPCTKPIAEDTTRSCAVALASKKPGGAAALLALLALGLRRRRR